MQLKENHKQAVALYAWTGLDDDAYTWGERTDIRAAVYPLGKALNVRICGEQVEERLLMLYDGDVQLENGMGVALDGGLPVYRIVELERWTHWTATLERIPEGRRSDAV